MNSRTTRRFRDLLAALPAHVRVQAQDAYELFCKNPSHPGLRFKKVNSDPPTYSARVGIGYRALGGLDGNTVIWYWIGSHADYDGLLKPTPSAPAAVERFNLHSMTMKGLLFAPVQSAQRSIRSGTVMSIWRMPNSKRQLVFAARTSLRSPPVFHFMTTATMCDGFT